MIRIRVLSRVLGLALPLLAGAASAAELRVVSSGGFAAAYRALAPEFERRTGDTLVTEWGPSMGHTPQAVPARLERGEPIDVVVMVGYALDDLAKQGKVEADTRTPLARSGIAIAVRAGAPQARHRHRRGPAPDPARGKVDRLLGQRERRLHRAGAVQAPRHRGPGQGQGADDPGRAGRRRGRPRRCRDRLPAAQRAEARSGNRDRRPAAAGRAALHGVLGRRRRGQPPAGAARALVRFLASPEAAAAVCASGMEPLTAGAGR